MTQEMLGRARANLQKAKAKDLRAKAQITSKEKARTKERSRNIRIPRELHMPM